MAIWAEIKKAINSNLDKPLNELINDGFSKGTVKSVQRGTITIDKSQTTGTATISSVTTSKSMLILLGTTPTDSGGTQYADYTDAYLTLTSSTVVTATRKSASSSTGVTVSYQIVEFY